MTDALAPAQDPAGNPLAERQLALLGELAEIGLQVARAVGRQAQEPNPDPAALSLAYARVSRAVRLTLQLQTQVLEGRAAPQAAAPRAPAEASPREIRRDRVVNIVERVAKDWNDDSDEVEELVYEASERLDDEDLYGDLMDHPVSDIVARICKDLGLRPDWKTLAEELWAKREIESGDVGGPLARFAPARPPPPCGGGGPLKGVEGANAIAALGPLSPEACPRAGLWPDPGGTAPPQAGEGAQFLALEQPCAPPSFLSSVPDG